MNQYLKDYLGFSGRLADLKVSPVGDLHSPVIVLFWRYQSSLAALLGTAVEEIEEDPLQRFERILRNTPKIVKDRKIQPRNEADVHQTVYELLIHVFPDTVREKSIVQGTKTYKPDIGVKSLKAAAEYKFADSEQEVKTAIGGLYEDMRGYDESEDWTRFIHIDDGYATRTCRSTVRNSRRCIPRVTTLGRRR